MKKLLLHGILGLCMFFTVAASPAPAEGQVVVKIGPTHHRYHHRYREVYYRHGHRYYRYYYR
jgi:hypothetical protein